MKKDIKREYLADKTFPEDRKYFLVDWFNWPSWYHT